MNKIIAASFVALVAAAPAGALEWETMGPRAMGMGGAGVALTQGPIASYWNPAALGRETENSYGLQASVSAHAALTGTVLEGVRDFKNVQNACQNLNATLCTQANVISALDELNQPGNGLRANGSAGGDFKIGQFSFFVNDFFVGGATPRVDLLNTNVPTTMNPNPANPITNNTSGLIVKGANITEFGAGYGHELPFAPGIFLGGDVKIMRAKVGYEDYVVLQNLNNGESSIISSLKNQEASSGNFGIDAGALWDVNRSFDSVPLHPRMGLVGRNLNNPKFDQPAAAVNDGVNGKFAVNPQARLGLSLTPVHWWNLAADVDLTRNLTPIDGLASRQLGVGTEVNVFNRSWINIPLRVGLARNLAETGAGTMLTAGGGLNFLHLIIDASGEFSPKTIQTQSQGGSSKTPQELGASVQLSFLFGGSERTRSFEQQEPPRTIPPQQATPRSTTPTTPSSIIPATPPPTTSKDLTPAQADQIRQHAADSQNELDRQTPPASTSR